jgi:hypothetical protein
LAIDYTDLGNRLAVAVRESPGFNEPDLELQKFYRRINSQRVWEIWTQCKMFDQRDRQLRFSEFSGLPTGVVNRYMEVCRKYEEDRATARIKQSRVKSKATSKK